MLETILSYLLLVQTPYAKKTYSGWFSEIEIADIFKQFSLLLGSLPRSTHIHEISTYVEELKKRIEKKYYDY